MNVSRAWTVLALASIASVPLGACTGGKASGTYKEYREALAKATKVEEVLPFLARESRARVEKTPEDQRSRVLAIIKLSSEEILELTVVRETKTETGTRLDVRGITGSGEDATGTVDMVREEGTFRVGKEDWTPAPRTAASAKDCDKYAADLKSTSAVTRARAAGAVADPNGFLQTTCLAAVPALADALADPVEGIRRNAGLALRSLLDGAAWKDPNAVAPFKSVFPRLVAAKETAGKAGEFSAEMNLQFAVAAFGTDAIAVLVKDLSHHESELRFGAAQLLGNLGPAAKSALPDVKAAAGVEKDELTRETLARAEKAIQGE
jgi:hypothetical protein